MISAFLQAVERIKALPPELMLEGLSLGQQWAMENGLAREWDEQFAKPESQPVASPAILETPIQVMLRGVEEISERFGFSLIALEGFEAPRVNVLRFAPAPNTDVTRVATKFDNVVARVPGMSADPAPLIRIIDGGLEILCARKKWQICYLADYVKRVAWKPWESLTITWGVAIDGSPITQKLVHALIAGMTDGGKTTLMNALLGQIVIRHNPWHVQWLLIDVEQVGLCQFDDSAWFWRGNDRSLPSASICDEAQAFKALQSVLLEHDRRLAKLKTAGVDSIERFNRKDEVLPHLLVVIDEVAVLRSRVGLAIEEAEESGKRNAATVVKEGRDALDALLIEISQRCRKTGIHLIVATQRAAADTIDPNLRDNLGTRIALRCNSEGGSSVAFGYKCDWAMRLAGNGDMWVISPSGIERGQGLFIDNEEVMPHGKTRLEALLHAAATHQPYIDWLAEQNKPVAQAPQKWGVSSQDIPPNPPKVGEPNVFQIPQLCREYRERLLRGESETAAIVAVFGHLHSNPSNAAAGNSRSKYLRWVSENK